MSKPDLLVIAGDAAERLEQHGVVACGRRIDGDPRKTRVDCWTHAGATHSYLLTESDTIESVVQICLAKLGVAAATATFVHHFDVKN